jgi:hypothetical protein
MRLRDPEVTMKQFLVLAVAMLATGGCASRSTPQLDSESDLDHARISAIEQQARLIGVRVIWVHAPRKVVALSGS